MFFFSPASCAIKWCHINWYYLPKEIKKKKNSEILYWYYFELPFWKHDTTSCCEFTTTINNHLTDLSYFQISTKYCQCTSHVEVLQRLLYRHSFHKLTTIYLFLETFTSLCTQHSLDLPTFILLIMREYQRLIFLSVERFHSLTHIDLWRPLLEGTKGQI